VLTRLQLARLFTAVRCRLRAVENFDASNLGRGLQQELVITGSDLNNEDGMGQVEAAGALERFKIPRKKR